MSDSVIVEHVDFVSFLTQDIQRAKRFYAETLGLEIETEGPDDMEFRAGQVTLDINIHTLFNFEPPVTNEEVRDASLQYVRKISGFTKPSQANEEAFARAVDEVAAASRRLLDELVTSATPKDREVEAERARARAAKRYATA